VGSFLRAESFETEISITLVVRFVLIYKLIFFPIPTAPQQVSCPLPIDLGRYQFGDSGGKYVLEIQRREGIPSRIKDPHKWQQPIESTTGSSRPGVRAKETGEIAFAENGQSSTAFRAESSMEVAVKEPGKD
jgi:hypothetical protein